MLTGYIAAFAAGMLFAVSDILVREASSAYSPKTITLLTLVSGLPLLVAMSAFLEGLGRMPLEAAAIYSLIGVLHFFVGRTLFYTSVSILGASTAAIITSPTPLLSSVLAWLFLGEEQSPMSIAGVAAVSLGIALSAYRPSGSPLIRLSAKMSRVLGLASGLSASLIFSVTAILIRFSGLNFGYPLTGAAISYASALIPAVMTARVGLGPRRPFSGGERALFAAITAGLIVTAAQAARYYSLTVLPVAQAIALISLFPVHVVALALIFKPVGERPSLIHLAGSIMAFLGVSIVVSAA